jgi:glycosyltransferase involved in cell wall biosynthesis
LNRLPARASRHSSDGPPRLIFLGRVTSWKGVETFLNIIQNPKLSEFEILFIVPESKDVDLNSLSRPLLLRTTVLDGKPISAYKPRLGDVHIYPANYGTDAKYIESVSLNCLELACLGVPTLLSKGGLSTWPDLTSLEIFHETEWRNLNQIALEILRISNIRFSDEIIHKVRNEVDIRNQINLLTALLV